MDRSWWWRFSLVIALVLIAVAFLMPNVLPEGTTPSFLPNKKITLGLDLQGGLHLQYSVEVEKAVSDKLQKLAQDVVNRVQSIDESAKGIIIPKGRMAVTVKFDDPAHGNLLDGDFFRDYPRTLEHKITGPGEIQFSYSADYMDEIQRGAVQKAMETIRNRVDAFGVTEPSISTRGTNDIVVQLPGLSEEDFERTKSLIGRTAQLEFRIVDEEGTDKWISDLGVLPAGVTVERDGSTQYLRAQTKEELQQFLTNKVPPTHYVGYEQVGTPDVQTGRPTADMHWRTYYLSGTAQLTGESINDASVAIDQRDNRPFVSLNFDSTGARIFADLTSKHVNDRMAILLDDLVYSAPVINEAIHGGRAQITMGGLRDYQSLLNEANDLVTVLQNGALPAPIHKQFETRVGPSLGQDSINAGMMSILVGSLLVILFMVIYYKKSGLITDLALFLNVMFIFAILTMFGATLTLPGLAGIVLTIGMAVDANVIIYERIREELRLGKTPKAAIEAGYNKALSAILDANITTAIAGFVLLQYGSGPIKGFAVTLLIGIVCSVFTALVVTRLVFDYLTNRRQIERLSI